jgi:APA family basic amino acid/polyamine antiporter
MKKGLFIRKPLKAAQATETDEDQHQLKRHLGAFNLTAIGIGAIIGAGIFVITGQAAALYAGPGLILAFIIASIVCVFAGLCYAELSSMIPVSGGSYSYSYVAMGEFPAWIVGWSITGQILFSSSTVAVGWSGYASSFLRDMGFGLSEAFTRSPIAYTMENGWHMTGAWINLPAVIIVLLIGIMISIGIKAATHFNNLMVVIKLTTIAIFIILGFSYIKVENLTPFIPENTGVFGEFGWSGVFRAAGLLFFAYIGFDTVSTLAQESINPQRDLPRGILGSLLIATIAYIITALVLVGIVPYAQLNVPDPMSVALNAMGGSFLWLKSVIKLAILAGLASVVLVQTLSLTRVFFTVSKDGLISRHFSKIHKTTKTPLFASLATSFFCVIIAGLLPVNILGELVSMLTLFLFAIVCLGVLILRYLHPEFERPFKVPFVPVVPAIGILVCFMQMCFLPLTTWIQFGFWLAFGLIVYFSYGIRHSKLRKA